MTPHSPNRTAREAQLEIVPLEQVDEGVQALVKNAAEFSRLIQPGDDRIRSDNGVAARSVHDGRFEGR